MQIQALSNVTGTGQALSLTAAGTARSSRASALSSAETQSAPAAASSSSSTATAAAATGTATTTSTDYTHDVMDTNKDGYVSFSEWVIYLFSNPGSAEATRKVQAAANGSENQPRTASAYNRQGSATGEVSANLVDLFA